MRTFFVGEAVYDRKIRKVGKGECVDWGSGSIESRRSAAIILHQIAPDWGMVVTKALNERKSFSPRVSC